MHFLGVYSSLAFSYTKEANEAHFHDVLQRHVHVNKKKSMMECHLLKGILAFYTM
jgi:hypothetical protein